MDQFEDFLVKQRLMEKTIYEYKMTIERFIRWYEETYGRSYSPEQLQEKDPSDYVAYLRHIKKRSANTVNKSLGGLRKYLEMLQRKGLWPYPIDLPNVKSAGDSSVAPKWLKPNEVAAILYAIEQEDNEFLRCRDRCMCFLELYRGIRIGELMDLQMDDIILTAGKQEIIIRAGKGDRYAKVRIQGSRKLLGALQEWIRVRGTGKHAKSPYLFTSFRSEKVTYRAVNKMVERIRDRAHIHFTTHQLRHTFVNEYLNISQGNLRLTKEAARHQSIETTLIYTQPSQEEVDTLFRHLEERY